MSENAAPFETTVPTTTTTATIVPTATTTMPTASLVTTTAMATASPVTTAATMPAPATSTVPAPATSTVPPPAATARATGGAEPCDLVTVPVRQGLEAVDILRRRGVPAVGPVLHDGACDTLGFLVPPGTAAAWDLPGSACTRTSGRGLRLPELPELPEPAGDAPRPAGWLLPPGDTGPVTDPADLRRALGEAARLIEAADGCH